jgi:acyl carrier protein
MTHKATTHDRLEATVLETLAEVVPTTDPSRIAPEIPFRDQVEMDSVDCLNFIVALEQRLDIRIPAEDYPMMSSLAGCVHYLEARKNGRE